jgi:gamma-glutamyltranspeptidase/glutathione hydrolase
MLALTLVAAALAVDLPSNAAASTKGMVASVHPLATEAGVAALRRGGNAIDAAIAVGLTLGVVDAHNSGLGGGCFILIRRADGRLFAIDGRETAPATATRDMFLKDGQPDTNLSQMGSLAVATPGALAAYEAAVKAHGRLRLAELVLPAAKIAADGFVLDTNNAGALGRNLRGLRKYSGENLPHAKPDGSPYVAGEKLQQPDLAKTYRAIAEHGIDWFYRGPFAKAVGDWMAAHGGVLTADDFAGYRPVAREPLVTTYRGRTIVGFPPPSSGGIHVAQILNILEQYDLAAMHARDAGEFQHVLAESMKLAFADRAFWLGDADFVRVPRGLIDKEYARSLAAKIDLAKSLKRSGHGTPPEADERVFQKHTTHVAAADAEGNWVAMTQTINTGYGSLVIVPGTGVVLNNEMDDFSVAPGQPNAFGLVGAEANAVAPLKRPLSSMSPTIVLQDGQPILSVGAAGGPTIITQVVQALVRTIDLKQPLPEALAQPRIHHQWSPDEVRIESRYPETLQSSLTARGHKLKEVRNMGVSQAIAREPATSQFIGVHDPRVPGKAAGP